MKQAIIIRYCEIHLKGKNRGFFEKLLKDNIKKSLRGIKCTFSVMHSRYLIEDFNETDLEIIESKLKKIAGIHTYSIARVVGSNLEEITNSSLELFKYKKGTFKVETNRADKKFTPNSVETSRYLGGKILEKYSENLKVSVTNPNTLLYVDIREDGKTFVYTDVVHCMSGMPVGSAGNGLLLISGGIDSPVAGYMMCKRGMKLNALHFHSFPYTGQAAKEKVIELSKKVGEYNGGIKLYVVSFTEIQQKIHQFCPDEFMITIMRRFMMRIAERLAVMLKDQTIITGESLGQVASQTIESITSSNSVVKMPILRPLIAFDKNEIIDISRKIDTYETSILPYEDCCTVFLPKFPAIRPNLQKVIDAESKLNVEELIDNVFKNIEKIQL
ncbi:MAG: tRNA 4-thiouridine(8) synthase ThiI [Clostridia bacterium]|nr:tRNA 4-thiouridine(8) synthase ThiI [Clostridia bacterium]